MGSIKIQQILEEIENAGSTELQNKENLEEGMLKDTFKGIVSRFQSLLDKVSSSLRSYLSGTIGKVKRFYIKTTSNNKRFLAYEQKAQGGTVVGYLYPDVIQKAENVISNEEGSSQKHIMKAYMKGDSRAPLDTVICFDRHLAKNMKASYMASKVAGKELKTNSSFDSHSQFNTKPENKVVASIPESKSNLFDKVLGELSEARFNADDDFVSEIEHKEIASKDKIQASLDSSDVAIPSALVWSEKKKLLEYLSSAIVTPSEISDILSEFTTALAFRTSKNQPVPSLLIQGFPGGGKTSIMKAFAEANGIKIHILEIASIYTEILGGFPTVSGKSTATTSQIDSRVADLKNDPNKVLQQWEIDQDEKGDGIKVVMRAADIFPEEDGLMHVFFMDEFNRDEGKMAAAMNLLLSGSIGSTYALPLKTIVVAAGNLGKEIDLVNVVQMDSATFDRFDAAVNLKRDVMSQKKAEFSYGPEGQKIKRQTEAAEEIVPLEIQNKYNIKMGAMNTSLDIWLSSMVEKYGSELLSGDWKSDIGLKPLHRDYQKDIDMVDENSIYMLSTRKIEKINGRLKNRAVRDWIAAVEHEKDPEGYGEPLVQPSKYSNYFDKVNERFLDFKNPSDWEKEWESKKSGWISKGIVSPCALYLHIMQWTDSYIPTVLKQMLGGEPGQLIGRIRNSVETSRSELRKITPGDIIFGYAYKRLVSGHQIPGGKLSTEEFKESVVKHGSLSQIVLRAICDVIIEYKTAATLSTAAERYLGKSTDEAIEEIKTKLSADGKKAPQIPDVVNLIALNLYLFIKDKSIGADNCQLLVRRMKELGLRITDDKSIESSSTKEGDSTNADAKEVLKRVLGALVQKSDPVVDARNLLNSHPEEVDKIRAEKKASKEKSTNLTAYENIKHSEEKVIEEGLKSIFKKMI